ncbi:MAG: cytochrome P450 [Acetobacteraceae bacterium]
MTVSVADLEADPHGVFRHYRPITPLIAREGSGYLVIRSHDVHALMRDPRLRHAETDYVELRGISSGAIYDTFRDSMLTANGAVHRRRRAPFTRTFAARLITDLRPQVRAIADDLIEEWHAEGEVDLIGRYASLIPARAVSRLFGLPQADIPHFTTLVYEVSRILSFTFGPDALPGIEAATRELTGYIDDLLRARRGGPAGDFLVGYLADADLKGELSPAEILVQIVTLIIGATDTTRVALAVQVALLLQHREQWEAICRDRLLIPAAVSESLRFEPSVGAVSRVTLEDIPLGGAVLPAGQYVSLSTMSAMRDATAYDRPDDFNIFRTDLARTHLVFGGGAHRCLGEALAWVELEEGLAALAARIPQLRLVGEPPHVQGHFGIRRIDRMRIGWS